MTPNRKLRVFLCHASQDKPIVRELYQRLLAEGWIDPWLDEEKLLPGQDWGMEIERAVETSDAVIVFLSSNSVTKEGYVQRELRKILDVSDEKPEGTIFVIPIRLDDVQIPRRLKRRQFDDFFPSNRKSSSYARLIASLMRRAEIISLPLDFTTSADKNISVLVCIFNESGYLTSDFQFVTERNTTVNELLLNIKNSHPAELPNDLNWYEIHLELSSDDSLDNLKLGNGAIITVRPV